MTTESLDEKVRTWLSTQGYRLEMVVAEHFHSAGCDVTISDFATDPKTNMSREIDVVATEAVFLSERTFFEFMFAVECKHSKEKPWIVFKSSVSGPASSTTRYLSRFATDLGSLALLEMTDNEEAEQSGLFAVSDSFGHSVTRAFEEKSDQAYAAMTQVCDGAAALIAQKREWNPPLVIFPAIVVQGKIFECTLQAGAAIGVTQVDEATVLWRRPTSESRQVFVDIVTDTASAAYEGRRVTQCRALAHLLENGLPHTRDYIVEARRKRFAGA